jgi:hypothetical protein
MEHCRLQVLYHLLALVLLTGCGGGTQQAVVSQPTGLGDSAASGQYHDELLTYAIGNLDRLEEFSSADALQQIIHRLDPQNRPKPGEPKPPDSFLAAWPEPEMLRQIVDRLNQWIRTQRSPADWKLDPMVATLPKSLANLPAVIDLDRMEFSRFDGYALQEAMWLRDVGRWARGDALDDLDRAKSLFDWTIRNIQIEPDNPNRIPLFPWETLLFGRGTAAERAWLFILMARQLDIDTAMLGLNAGGGGMGTSVPIQASSSSPRPWCVAVLVEGNAYLFDPLLGLPIPAPDGVKLGETGQLEIQPATLAQVIAHPKLLRQLDADETHVYGVKASDLKHVTVMLEASPDYLTRRMRLLESRLVGPQKMVLTTSPTAHAERWKAVAHAADVQLWLRPFETLQRRSNLTWEGVQARLVAALPFYAMPSAPLLRGRVLYLKGKFIGDDGAMHYYQAARPSNEELSASSAHVLEKLVYLRGKQDAGYWAGLIAYQRGNYPAAIDYFTTRTLLFTPNGPWTTGARYNLARAFEASGDPERAILQYGNDPDSPGYLGDLLRAKWLKQQNGEGKKGN